MLYCTKCHGVCPDATAKCPNCKSAQRRQLNDDDLVLLHRADQYTASLLEQQFQERGIAYRMDPFSGGRICYLYEGDVMPTDKQVLVRWGDYDAAKEISSQVKLQVEKERAVGDGEEYEEMSPKKRIVVQIVSVFFFILLIMLAVYGTDAIANWLKGLFG